jgi:hypothetical protein
MNVKVIAKTQNKDGKNHRMCRKSRIYITFQQAKHALKVANMLECSSGSRWKIFPTIRGKK